MEDDGLRSARSPQSRNGPGTEGLLATPSEELIADAEDLERKKLELQKLGVRRQIEEEMDFFREREQEQEDSEEQRRVRLQERRHQQQREQVQLRERQRRQRWQSQWIEHALQSMHYDAPEEMKLQVHKQVNLLQAGELSEWHCFEEFETALQNPGPWIAGIDLPFGQSRTFIENIDWPKTWPGYVDHARTLGRKGFRAAVKEYRMHRPVGDKEHRRATDVTACSLSPQKIDFTPVGLMFFEGAPRLLDAGVTIPGLQDGDPSRICVEAYPGVLARRLIGRRSYKQDTKKKQTEEQKKARQDLMGAVLGDKVREYYGLRVNARISLADDPKGDGRLVCSRRGGYRGQRHDQLPWR